MKLELNAKTRLLGTISEKEIAKSDKLNGAQAHKFVIDITAPIAKCIKQRSVQKDGKWVYELSYTTLKPGTVSRGSAYISSPVAALGNKKNEESVVSIEKATHMWVNNKATEDQMYFPVNPGLTQVSTLDLIWVPLKELMAKGKLSSSVEPMSKAPKLDPQQLEKAIAQVAKYMKTATQRSFEFDTIVSMCGKIAGLSDLATELSDSAYEDFQSYVDRKIFKAACKEAGVNPKDYE